jgi:hypothetical protein
VISAGTLVAMYRVGTGAVALLGLVAVGGCGESSLSESEIKHALENQPLTYHYRAENYSGDGAVVGGTATNGKATVRFEVVAGEPEIKNPLFPQNRNNIDKFQRGTGTGYTITFSLPSNRKLSRLQAPIANAIDGAICSRVNDCGGPAG